ncbi:hypothetical protein ACHAXH_006553 [Discostella pseudostelligera]
MTVMRNLEKLLLLSATLMVLGSHIDVVVGSPIYYVTPHHSRLVGSSSIASASSTAFLSTSDAWSKRAATTTSIRPIELGHSHVGTHNRLRLSSPPSTLSLSSSAIALPVPELTLASSIFTAFSKFYVSFPFAASFLTASILAALADAVAQYQDECITKFDAKRNLAMILYSGLISGICVEFMYSRIFPQIFRLSGKVNLLVHALKMTIVDECINAPILWLPPAYIFQAVLYRTSKREAVKKYILDVKTNGLLTKYWSLWLPMSFINFSIIPSHFRVAFVAVVSFFWMIILSIVTNRRNGVEEKEAEPCPAELEPPRLNPRAWD